MTDWIALEGESGRFFVAESSRGLEESELSVLLGELLDGWSQHVLGNRELDPRTSLFFEVNCDTGRLILASGTETMRAKGLLDGCAIRAQSLQDFWYDLDESGASESEFTDGVHEKVRMISEEMLAQLRGGRCAAVAKASELSFVAFGVEREVEVLRSPI